MKKMYSVEVTDTLVALGIILAFFGLMAAIAFLTGM